MAAAVEIRFYALLRRRLERRRPAVDGDGLSVLDLLSLAEEQAGRPFLDELLDRGRGLLSGTMILVNGENIRLKQGLATRVRSGDVVDLFSPAGGG